MKKFLGLFCFFSAIVFSVSAIEVDKPEIDSTKNKQIEFINYEGTHNEVDTVEAIRGIGTSLGSAARTGRAGSASRYMVIHCVDASVKEGLDADIFIVGKNASVDHINNLRLMIAGYLQAAYNYSRKDAVTIAHFVTIYNAVYRNQMGVFKQKYKSVVLSELTEGKAGLALKYDQWPGQTQIVIPLSDKRLAGTISSVDTKSISDKKVVGKMKEEDGKDIEKRKEMVNLKERESKAAEKRAIEEKKEAAKKEKQAKKDKQAADKKEKDAAKKKKDADEAKKKAEKTGSDEDKKIAEQKQKESEEAEKEAEEAKEKAEQTSKEAEEKAEEAKEDEALAQEKDDEAQAERKDIASDSQRIVEEKKAEKKAEEYAAIDSAIAGYGLKVVEKGLMLSELVLLDLKTENELKTSSINTIRGRNIFIVGKNLMAIAGTKSGDAVIALVLIDAKSLEIVKQSEENIAEESLLVKHENSYYAVVDKGGKYFIGRYNDNIELQASSAIEVSPYTPITVGDKGLLVQDANNVIRLLKFTDLTNIVATEE